MDELNRNTHTKLYFLSARIKHLKHVSASKSKSHTLKTVLLRREHTLHNLHLAKSDSLLEETFLL